jgi:hypothetical protein
MPVLTSYSANEERPLSGSIQYKMAQPEVKGWT